MLRFASVGYGSRTIATRSEQYPFRKRRINGYLKARSEVYDFVIFVENNKSNGNSQSIFLEGVSQASLIIAHTRKKVILLPSQWTVMKAKDRSNEALAKE